MATTRRLWLIPILALGIVLVGALAFVIWATTTPTPMPEARAALESDGTVTVAQGEWIVFRPAGVQPDAGIVFYPGGRVDPVSYAPAMRELAARGYLVVVTPMPLNLAFFDSDRAEDVIADFPEIERWVIGGHSLGGAMAARYAASDPPLIRGLTLWGAYPGGDDDLSVSRLAVASIYGTADGLTTVADIEASRPLLPTDARFVAVEGGNHAQFGWYGEQEGDGQATIGRDEQQAQTVAATLELMRAIDQ